MGGFVFKVMFWIWISQINNKLSYICIYMYAYVCGIISKCVYLISNLLELYESIFISI